MKIMLLLFLIILSTRIGWALSGAAERRFRTLDALFHSLQTLNVQIFNMLEPLQDALRSTDNPLFLLVAECLPECESCLEAWRKVAKNERRRSGILDCLNEQDVAVLEHLFSHLGESCRESQGDVIRCCISSIEQTLSDAKNHALQTGRLYTYVGFLVGLGAVILMI